VLEEAHRHLGAAGVVHAQEEDGRLAVVVQAFDLGQGPQPLPGEAFSQVAAQTWLREIPSTVGP
jgi:hypothetical protein